MLITTGVLSGTVATDLEVDWLERLGYAARDLPTLDFWRLFSSALVTESPRGFYQALALVTLGVGGLELRRGTLRATLSFWGLHLATLLVNAGVYEVVPALAEVGSARDVGPSAGYFGCLAAFSATFGRWGHSFNVLLFASLIIVFAHSVIDKPSGELSVISANLAHVVAYALGWGMGVVLNKQAKVERAR